LTPEQVEGEMACKPLPNILPPAVPYPLDPVLPSIWNPDIANPPNSRPLRVPQGNPQPIPNTDPQQWRQPVTRWTSSPTLQDPWRMDVQPEDVTSTDPTGIKEPTSVPTDTPTSPKEDAPDLCGKNPDILACAKVPELDTPDDDIPRDQKQVSFTEESLFGSGSCPADVTMSFGSIGGKQAKIIDWQKFCGMAVPLRALVLALAALTAAFILMPGGVRE
jgi:hypothetical protein